MITVPHRLLDLPTVDVLFYNEKSTILHKRLYSEMKARESYVSQPALSIVLQGEQIIRGADGSKIRLKAGQMSLMQKGIYTISDLIPTGETYESLVVFFDEDNVQKIFPSTLSSISPIHFATVNCPMTIPIFIESLLASFKILGRMDAILGEAKITELLCLLKASKYASDFTKVFSSPQENIRRNLIDFMENHFDKALRVEDYAYLTGRSLTTFRRDFKEKYQQTPQTWLKTKRMHLAKTLLDKKEISVTNTAYEVGYQNVSHFIKSFKNEFGLSPKQYLLSSTFQESAKTV